jgi:hypothetical protein
MPGPVVFISHSRVRPGRLDALRDFMARGAPALRSEKPRTLAFLPYLNEDASELSIVHVFADPESFAVHLEGAAERGAVAYEFIETLRFEIYGDPGAGVLAAMQQAAERLGAGLRVEPDALTGFLRSGAS